MTKEHAKLIVSEFSECGESIEALCMYRDGPWYAILLPIPDNFSETDAGAQKRASRATNLTIHVVRNWHGGNGLLFVSDLEHLKEGSETEYGLMKLWKNSYKDDGSPE